MHTPKAIELYYRASQVEYRKLYLALFASFSAWYLWVTDASTDRRALSVLSSRPSVWKCFFSSKTETTMYTIMKKAYTLLLFRPFESDSRWEGRLKDSYDWQGMLWFWYTVRCQLVHGNEAGLHTPMDTFVQYAYESLSLFMTEILRRLQLETDPSLMKMVDELPSGLYERK